jgi:phosphatidylserine/phosphatidylglycerophosphate/cardiolipin synthase-like enzyme
MITIPTWEILQDNIFIQAATRIVAAAAREILISTFKLEYPSRKCLPLKEFFDTLIDKASAGLDIHILFNWHPNLYSVPRTNFPTARFLKEKGIHLRYLENSRCCHSKLLLADKDYMIIGSHNLSIASARSNFDVSLSLRYNRLVFEAHARFWAVYSGAKPF